MKLSGFITTGQYGRIFQYLSTVVDWIWFMKRAIFMRNQKECYGLNSVLFLKWVR